MILALIIQKCILPASLNHLLQQTEPVKLVSLIFFAAEFLARTGDNKHIGAGIGEHRSQEVKGTGVQDQGQGPWGMKTGGHQSWKTKDRVQELGFRCEDKMT